MKNTRGMRCKTPHLTEREIISARIRRGMNDPDPEKRAQWEAIPHEGEITTPEEWLYYAVNTLIENGDEDLLRRYPNL